MSFFIWHFDTLLVFVIAALNIDRRKLSDLNPHPRNPRVHPEVGSGEWNALQQSLEHDYFDPLVLNERNGMLVSGHYRRKVFQEMGVTEVDVVVVDYDEPTHLARLLAANKQFGDWDADVVEELVVEIEGAGVESWLAGFLSEDWREVLDVPDDLEDDAEDVEEKMTRAEELQEKWLVRPGEMFRAGGVSLFCGDCTDGKNWDLLLDGVQGDMVWTDPPYNVDYAEVQVHRKGSGEAIANDAMEGADYKGLLVAAFVAIGARMKEGGSIYIAHADAFRFENESAAEEAGFGIKQCLIWVKSAFALGRQDYQWQHEPILYGWKRGAAHFWQGGFCQATVDDSAPLGDMEFDELLQLTRHLLNDRNGTLTREARGSSKEGHPTVKPLPLVARHVWNSSRKGEMVMEPFAGSGTTLLAAHHTGRRCVGTELEPKFCAVILERLEEVGLEIVRYEPETDS